jgi:hypothetical protein
VGCAPPFTVVGLDQIRMPRLVPLTPLLASATAHERLAPARLLVVCFKRLYAAGICHRDGHRDNFVLDGPRALLIDFELACSVYPEGLCYDLVGPASGIAVPWEHQLLGMTQGSGETRPPSGSGSCGRTSATSPTFRPRMSSARATVYDSGVRVEVRVTR